MPREEEFIKRAKDVMEGIAEGRFEHCDLALYHLQLNATQQHQKKILSKADLPDIRDRIRHLYPESDQPIPAMDKDHLPQELKDFIQGEWKIEWMYKGNIMQETSEKYKQMFKYNKKGVKVVYSKVVDTLGFSRWDMAFKMWIESLMRPGKAVWYEGQSFHMDTKTICMQKASMMTMILDFDHVITVTIIQ
jgi:hypothetical protein